MGGEGITDRWARWLLGGREGGDLQLRERTLTRLRAVRDQVLDRAAIQPDDVVLDVGAGDGLIAFGALERLGAGGRVIFADVSSPLLDHCRQAAVELGAVDRCSFVECSAEDLRGIDDMGVDVVTTRSVLIYVDDKKRALAEFFRVLRPGGRISLWEPINRLMHPEQRGRWNGYDVSSVQDLADRVTAAMRQAQPDSQAMVGFDDRDLFDMTMEAGFLPVHLELRRDFERQHEPRSWESFERSSPNPLAPTLEEVLARALAEEEVRRFVACVRPQVESGVSVAGSALLQVWGEKPRVPAS